MAEFLRLPTELMHGIIAYIARPTDLKSLALVSRNMHDLVTPYLYREVVLPYGNTTGLAVLHSLLQSTQRSFVRVVKLIQEGHAIDNETYLELTVMKLLSRLPDNSLTRLEWDGSCGVRSEVLGALWQLHRGIQNFRLPSAMLHATLSTNFSCWNDLPFLGSIFDVNLTIRHPDDMRAASKALEFLDLSHVKKFSAVFELVNPQQPEWQVQRGFFCGNLHLTLTVLGLGGHKVSFNNHVKILNGMGSCLEFPVLNRLEIRYCTNMDVFFATIRTPVLKHFELRLRTEIGFDTQEYNQSVNTQFNIFLRRFCGLQTLLLQTRQQPLTIARDIMQQHAPTLRIYLNTLTSYVYLFVPEWFKALKQFAIYALYGPEPGDGFSFPDYRVSIANFCNSTSLTTLGLLHPPVDDPLKPWKESLHELADTIFAATTGSKLRVIAFGLDHNESWPEEIYRRAVTYPNRLCFVRNMVSEALAEGAGLALEVDEKELRWSEPELDIIQYRFSA